MSDVSSLIDLNDADIITLEKVIKVLNKKMGQRQDMDSFRREILERFHDVGFRVDVKVWQTDQLGLYAFDIEIQERLEGQFDPDQMVYEATKDILDLGEGGVISTKGILKGE